MPVKKAATTPTSAAKKTTTAAKTTARKTTTRAKSTATTAAKKTAATTKTTTTKARTTKASNSTSSQVAANARHIEENTNEIKNNSKMIHLLYGTIILLLMIIAGLAFYVGQITVNKNTTTATPSAVAVEDITITIIDDMRCSDCPTDSITQQLQALPFLVGANFVEQDFADAGVSQYLQDNNITALPAVIFNTNVMNDGGQITPFLTPLADEQYSLALGATFDPFATRSENGFLIMDESVLAGVQADAHYKGESTAKITWLEYTDVNCHYCKKMELDGTAETVMTNIGADLNKTSSNYIGVGGAASQLAAEILECAAISGGSDLYNSMLSEALVSGDNSRTTLIASAVAAGVDESSLNACVDNGETKETVERKFTRGKEAFGITGTPGNVIINNETGEYEIISGAYPADAFEDVINRMLGK